MDEARARMSTRTDATPSATTTAAVPRAKAMNAQLQLVLSTLKAASSTGAGGDGDDAAAQTLRRVFPVLMEQNFNPMRGACVIGRAFRDVGLGLSRAY